MWVCQLYIDPLNFVESVLFTCSIVLDAVRIKTLLATMIWDFSFTISPGMFYGFRVWERAELALIILEQITRIGWPNWDCIRIAKINMFSFEMRHKNTTYDKRARAWRTREEKNCQHFVHSCWSNTYIVAVSAANMKKHFYCSAKMSVEP